MELVGRIESILSERSIGSNGTVVNGFVIRTEGSHAHCVQFDVYGVERWSGMSEAVVVGNRVNVVFDVSSREWNGRWYTSCVAFRVVVLGV